MEGTQHLSRRQQRKLDQAIKLINQMEALEAKHHEEDLIEPKPHKKRKTSTKVSIVGQPPIQPTIKPEEIDHAAQSTSACHLTPQHQKAQNPKEKQRSEDIQHQEKNHLNPSYPLPDGEVNSYLICYQYSELQKQMDKQNSDFSRLDELGELVEMVKDPKTETLMKKVMEALREHKSAIGDHPFSRNHLQLSSKLFSLRD